MSISIGANLSQISGPKDIEEKLKLDNSTDDDLMSVCKSFESYMVEQVFKEMKKSVSPEEEENDYLKYFGDILNEEYAKSASENDGIGIAKMLYESMKRDNINNVI